MWIKFLATAVIFYFMAVLQNSFLAHFNILGVTPNLVLIFYFLIVFFSAQGAPASSLENSFYAFAAGFLLDAFSHNFFGVSIVLLLILMFAIKKALQLLWERSDEYSVVYFISLFIAYLAFYNFLLNITLLVFAPEFADFSLNWKIFITGAYNLFFALIGFYFFDRFGIFKNAGRQLKLFQ